MRQYPPRRRHVIKVALSDEERARAEAIARTLGVSLAHACRLALLTDVELKNKSSRAA